MRNVFVRLAFLLGLLAGPMAAAARAAETTTTVTLTGMISAGRDYAGLFGPWGRNLTGKSFTAVYTMTTLSSSSVGSGMDIVGLGAGTTLNFSIRINTTTRTGTANSFGSLETEDGVDGLFAGGFDRVDTLAVQTINYGSFTKTFDLSASIRSSVNDILSDDKSLNAIPSLEYDVQSGDLATGRFQFAQSVSSTVLAYGLFDIRHISVVSTPEYFMPSPVPEPGEWAMMLAGLAVVGAVARRRR